MRSLGRDFQQMLSEGIKPGRKHGIEPGRAVRIGAPLAMPPQVLTAVQAVAMARALLKAAGLQPLSSNAPARAAAA